jgi:hypothetical protein
MRVHVLDRFQEGNSEGVLCRVEFADYVSNLPDDFRDYFVQRGITANRYLDNLWETIVEKKHIPLMVLVAGAKDGMPNKEAEINLGEGWKILDGLQRTHRMKLLYEIVQFQIKEVDTQPTLLGDLEPIPSVVKAKKKWLLEHDCPPSLFVRVLRSKRSMSNDAFEKVFEGVNLWLEVWFGLGENEQIQKMLILNAGHKSVNIKHQIELLFSDYFDVLKHNLGGREVVRERDKSSITYSKSRRSGQFHFAHLVTAFQSLDAGKPVSTNADFAAEKSLGMASSDESKLDINIELLEAFAGFLCKLDNAFSDKDIAIKWLGREVILAGLFAAIGKYSDEIKKSKAQALNEFSDRLASYYAWLNLDGFEQARNSLNLAKVNIGNKNKYAVQNATLQFLKDPNSSNPEWHELFDGGRTNGL